MSYILDALRKADAQRERDASRGIHAQALPLGAAQGGKSNGARAALWGAVLVGVASLGYAAWHLARPAPPAQVAAPPAPPPMPVAEAPAPMAPPAPATAVMPPAPPVVVQAPPPAPAPAPAVPKPPAAAEVRASPPPDAPKLAITGGVYSSNRAQRMLIVNGQVFNEGAEPVPGIVLEEIRPNTAVLNYRGQRYTVGF